MSAAAAMAGTQVRFHDVSKFYSEVLGVNGVSLTVEPGITALVGPNGSGKSTLMNLMTGLIGPTRGTIDVLGHDPREPETFRHLGYCAQFDAFPRAATGLQFIAGFLRLFGYEEAEVRRRAWAALEKVQLVDAAKRRVAGYSKGMRQRVKLAQAMAHDPQVIVLDEPLNGLDPMARSEFIALFRELAEAGRHVLVSSHILHEVDLIADQIVMLHQGYVVAEGDIPEMREEMVVDRPLQVAVRCANPARLAAILFAEAHVVKVELQEDGGGLVATTRDADRFYLLLNELASRGEVGIEAVAPADEDAQAVYRYLIGGERDMSTAILHGDAPLDAPAGAGRRARLRAFRGVLRLEWRRQLLTPRLAWPLLLALLPVAVTSVMAWAILHFHAPHSNFAEDLVAAYANTFHGLVVRLVMFFGCLALFLNLVRGEVEERTFHYLLLAPVPRPLLVLGKYVAAVGSAWLLFGGATVASFLIIHLPTGLGSAFTGAALRQLAAYLGMAMLGCVGYGGAFLLLGSVLRSPGYLVAVFFGWEWFEFLLPPLLKQLSVVHYLKALTPVPISDGPFALLADPTPIPVAVLQVFVYAAVTVSIAAWATKRTDLDYGKG